MRREQSIRSSSRRRKTRAAWVSTSWYEQAKGCEMGQDHSRAEVYESIIELVKEGDRKEYWTSKVELFRDFFRLPFEKGVDPETGNEMACHAQKPIATHF